MRGAARRLDARRRWSRAPSPLPPLSPLTTHNDDDVDNDDDQDDDKFYDDNDDYLDVGLNDWKLILPNLPFSPSHLGHR